MPRKLPMEEAVFRAVESGRLSIHSDGTVWRRYRTKMTRADRYTGSYLQVCVMIGSRRFCTGVHRLVWRYFHGQIPIGLTVNHMNGVKTDNRIENLELATDSEQQIHANRVLGTGMGARQHGERNHQSKLTNEDVGSIRRLRASGVLLREIAELFGISVQQTSRICLRQRWIL